MFKPNPVDAESAVKSQTMGALFAGSYHQVKVNDRVQVLWEVGAPIWCGFRRDASF